MRGARALGTCLLGLIGVFSQACSKHVDPSELVGTYSVTYPFGQGSLHLDSKGQYEQMLRIGGRTASAKGEWSHTEAGGHKAIFLQGCLSATNGFGSLNERWETPSNGACSWSITRRFVAVGAIELADDEQYYYREVSVSAEPNASPVP